MACATPWHAWPALHGTYVLSTHKYVRTYVRTYVLVRGTLGRRRPEVWTKCERL
jgi:hypothetical protein